MTDCLITVMLSVSETSPGRVVFFGLHITDNIKSAVFAFPGDPSVNLRMTGIVCVVAGIASLWLFGD